MGRHGEAGAHRQGVPVPLLVRVRPPDAAERAIVDAETELEGARQRVATLEAAAELPPELAAAQAELAALRGL
jgi:hypothetical protein